MGREPLKLRRSKLRTCKVEIVHSLPGRIRVRIKGLQDNKKLARSIERTFRINPQVGGIKANSVTGKALIIFDPNHVTEKELLKELTRSIQYICEKIRLRMETVPKAAEEGREMKVYEPEDLPLRTQYTQVIGTGIVLVFLLLKRILWGKSAGAASSFVHTVAAVTTIITGYPILRSGVDHLLVKKKLNNDFLISAATVVSLLMKESITGLVVVWLVNLSTLFQTLTIDKSRKAIRDMLQGKEQTAWLEVDGTLVAVPIESLQTGDIVACHVGEKIPVDGKVVRGEASVSQAIITGESMPVHKRKGEKIFAGSIVEEGSLRIKAEKVGEDTSVARIIQLVEQSGEVRAPIENIADRYSEKIVPLSFGLAALIYLLTGDFKRSMTMLIVACPCAAGLSTPTAVSAALGNAARKGILIKGGSYLEKVGSTEVVLFDKTGTLTEGKPTVRSVIIIDKGHNGESIIQLAASLEAHTNHPLAKAVVDEAGRLGLSMLEVKDKKVIIGHGVTGQVDGETLLIGSEQLLDGRGVNIARGKSKAYRLNLSGQTVLYVAQGDVLIGLIGISDKLREQSPRAIRRLRVEAGIEEIGLITGDCAEIGKLVGQELGLDKVWTEVLPEDKVKIVRSFQEQGLTVTMVGEGINDSPALAQADVGIAMGTGGTDIAIESADVVLAGDDPNKVPSLINLSNRTMEVVKQNFIFAVGINALGLVLGAGKWISPLTAAILHNLSTFGVVVNSSKLLTYNDSERRLLNGSRDKRIRRKDEADPEKPV
jgi:heavy metal translocating P-type ATPase